MAVGIFEKLRLGSRTWQHTIAVLETQPRLRSFGLASHGNPDQCDVSDTVSHDTFKIRLAHDAVRTREARILVEKRYSEKGYSVAGPQGHKVCPERITLATYKGEVAIGTLTIGFDTGAGLLVDELYGHEIDALRRQGRKVCEFTKLAIDSKRTSKRMMAGLFHIAYLYAGVIWEYNDIVIEVNPSHVPFYERMLGFQIIGEERLCPRVNAPAVLLRAEVEIGRDQIREFGGRPELGRQERNLFPYFLSPAEERNILNRLMQS